MFESIFQELVSALMSTQGLQVNFLKSVPQQLGRLATLVEESFPQVFRLRGVAQLVQRFVPLSQEQMGVVIALPLDT